ncbi:MAG TPA: hypothetical protein PL041_05425, partial [Melioribacteraceae bacterium]|nr:hypothetical protein [Melioribacteraceae bacterium]
MKKLALVVFCIMVFMELSVAQTRPFGIGLMGGDPTGINVKYYLNSINAVEVGLGVGVFSGDNSFALHVDYLYHNKDIIKASESFPIF